MNRWEKETVLAQVKSEQQALKDLEKAYKQAKKDVQASLKALNARGDMQNLQTIVYQKKYQQALLKQIDDVLNDLETHTYKTANDFFQGSYQNGYIGSMYELQKQGIPITVPVDTKEMMTAIKTDSKLSTKYYTSKGLNVSNIKTLKKNIALEATRGIASGKSWLEVANLLTIQRHFQVSQSDAMRIMRTEGNRINQQGRLDSGNEAVKSGCNILKQWDATLDSRTRPAHAEADGQIVKWDEDFIVGGEKMKAPSVGGSASNVCNCRCQLLKRPRWALDEDELNTLKERAEYFGLDKTKSFEEYKKKFITLPPVKEQIEEVARISPDEIMKTIHDVESELDDAKQRSRVLSNHIGMANWRKRAYPHSSTSPEYDSWKQELETLQEKIKNLQTRRIDEGKKLVSSINHTFEVKNPSDDFVDLVIQLYGTTTYNEVAENESEITLDYIKTKVGGADKTNGSCASLGFAYAGNKCGFHVLDFRGGESQHWFARNADHKEMWKSLGITPIIEDSAKTNLTNAVRILNKMEAGKEYYLSVGKHASIVRKNQDESVDYLELQSSIDNGWNSLTNDGVFDTKELLKWRFGCSTSSIYRSDAVMVDVEDFKNNKDEFRTILGFINTAEDKQMKGTGGDIK